MAIEDWKFEIVYICEGCDIEVGDPSELSYVPEGELCSDCYDKYLNDLRELEYDLP